MHTQTATAGDPYEYRNGEWIKVEAVARETSIDASRFGASSVEELSSLLKDPAGALELTVDNAFSVYKAYPELLSQQQKNAVEFAMAQGRDEAREQVYRGSILGAMLVKLGADEEGGEDVSSRRQALQEAIVSEIEKYGHPANNPKLTLTGQSSRAFGAFMNSIDTQGNFSALLAGTLDKATAKGYVEDNLADIVVHLQKLQGDQIELEDVKALYKGAAPLESLGDLAGIEGIAITPDGMLQPAARYCAGDVVSKMAALADAIGKTEDERLKSQFQKQIEEMNRKIQRVGVEDITFGLQNNWFSKKYIVEFLRENGYPDAVYGEYRDVEYEEDDGSITQRNRFVEDMDSVNGHFHLYGAGSRKPELFPGQFEKYLNGDRITSTDKEKIQAYKEEASRLEAAFDSWMKQHLDVDELTEQYNLKFNGHVPVEYDSTPLDIDDIISGEIKPHTYQCAEVRRLSEQGAGICGFGTGLGKSFTALAMAGYNYKHGRAKRTCVVVPSAVLENWYHESRIFYSEGYMRSNVLFVGLEPKVDQDGNIERRPILDEKGEAKIGKDGKPLMQDVIRFLKGKEDVYEAMWKIPQSNYSLVVMTKEKFQSIPIKPSTMKEYTDDMVKRHLMSEKEAASIADAAAKKRRSYQEDVHQAQLEGRFSDERTEKKGELPYLEDMGFDSIITDESHFFKNSLSGGDKTKGIVYVPNPKTSNIAVDMAIKSSWLRRKNNGRGIYGLTATPVTNSPVEIYNMLNLVAPKEEFESMGIHTVDDFVRFFGDIQQRMRSAVSGEIVNSDTLVGFKNLSGLRNLFRKYVNIKTVKDVDDEIHVPYAVEMEEEVDMTEEQALAYEGLRARAKEASKNRGANKGSDSIFSIMRDMDRCTTDMDLFKRQMTFILPREHKAKMAGLLPKLPTEFTIVEEDEVTGEKVTYRFDFEPKLIDNGGDSFSVIVHEQHEAAVLKAIREYGIPENEATHPLTPKYAKMVENLKKHLDAGGKQIVFTEEKSQHQKIKRLLVHNLPITEDQIAIINAEEASGDKLDKISKAYNAGSVKIVIANKKAEVGVNLQKGTTAIHHLTLPWTPASISQRNGRGVRQGNKVDSVDVYYYYGKGTFDSYRKQLLQAKAGWIGELLMGKESRAENADVAADEEMMAALTGTLEEYRAQKAAEEERRKNAAKAQLVNRLRQLTSIHSSLATLEGRRTKAKEDADYEVQAQERRIRKYEQENKGEEVLRKAQEKLEKLKAKAASVDGKYDAEKKKSEAQRNMITGMLRQAGKDGSLPFDVSLIDHPENCLVSLDGEMYAIGEFLEFAEEENSNYYGRNPSGVCRITGLDQADRTLRLENVMTGSTYRVNTKKLSSYAKKVSYSASELAMKRLLAGNMSYEALHGSGLTMQQFMENAGSVTIYGGAFVEDSTGKMTLIRWESEKSEDLSFVWPEPDNEDFRKRAMIAYLDAIKTVSAYSDPFMTVMTSLFGEEYRAEAEKYANNATPAEMHTILARAWETYTDGKLDTPEAKIAFSATWQSEGYNSILGIAIKAFKQDGYDNLIEMRGLSKAYLSCKYQEVLKMAEDAEREIRRQHDEELRKHPDFKEISSEWRDKFRTLGLDICYNTEDANLKFKRKVQKFGPYSRLFLCDSRGIGGILYRLKEMMKKRFDADFTKDWHEKAGAWWHVPATVDLEELYDFFA